MEELDIAIYSKELSDFWEVLKEIGVTSHLPELAEHINSSSLIQPGPTYKDPSEWIEFSLILKDTITLLLPAILIWLGKGKSIKIKKPDGSYVHIKNLSDQTCTKIMDILMQNNEIDLNGNQEGRIDAKRRK